MTTIVIYESKQDTSFITSLCEILSLHGGVLLISKESIKRISHGMIKYLILVTDDISKISVDNCILIVNDKPDKIPKIASEFDIDVIINDLMESEIKTFKKNKIPVITCGMSKNTIITLSSFDENSALICIQKSICLKDDNQLEPCELFADISHCHCSDSKLLKIAAVLILCHKFNDGKINL